ncbi:hypothetical protein Q8F55_008267 [Vanrija albida]|uniref:DUF2428 domain-containing protein n=1 Tax=Vanrija albida TaxID=181172 RepID=A0ABR3PW61_9TREE
MSELEVARKALHKTPPRDLLTGNVISDAIDRVLQPPAGAEALEKLAYLIVLFRQIALAVTQHPGDAAHAIAVTYTKLGPTLLPRAPLATLLLESLSNTVKPHPLRSAEAMTAATRLAAILPPPPASSSASQHLLQPLWADVLRDGLGARGNIVAVSIMAESIPAESIPVDLLPRLLEDLTVSDSANVRCSAIVTLLGRRRELATGTNEEKDRFMLEPLLPYVSSGEDGTAVQVLSRYLLPPLFKAQRGSFSTLLNMFDTTDAQDQPDLFASWITTASLGVSSGIIPLSGVPQERLHEAIVHEDNKIRIMAFELVARSKDVLEAEVMDKVKEAFRWNTMIPHAEGRTDMASAIYAFLMHLKELEHAARRDVSRGKTLEIKTKAEKRLVVAADFHDWFVNEHLTPSLEASQSHPALRGIFALKTLKLYLDVFSEWQNILEAVYTPRRVTLLLACQASEFTDIRGQARSIIERAPLPLAGYETLSTPATRELLASASASINHPRRTQADAGRAALSILFTKVVLPSGPEVAAAFIDDLVTVLENHIKKSEENFATGIVEYPLHGPLSALTEMVRCLDLQTPEAQAAWGPVLHRLSTLVDRVWAVTRKVISLGPTTDSEDGKETAAHEIARAYDVLGDDEADAGEDLDHTNLLSGSWRATKEAAELLSALITVPLNASATQNIWSRDEVHKAGRKFLVWLHEIRHRGTFSRIAPALGYVVDAVKPRKELAGLVELWVQEELDTIALGELSTLRRSAGLPYAFLALVSSDEALLDTSVERLVDMAKLGPASKDETKVHAMNTLKIVLLDGKQTRFLSRYLERTLLVALRAFESSNWNVRNVGLILFSTLAHRSLATARYQEVFGTRNALAGRQTLAAWDGRYPEMIPYVANYLRLARKEGPATLTQHSPLFPILIIVRSLRWSPEGAQTADSLFPVVEPYLGSVEWQIRDVASQALSSLLSSSQALERAKVTATRVSHDSKDFNTLHGRLLFLCRLISDVIYWDEVAASDKRILELRLRDGLQAWGNSSTAVIPKAILDCVTAYANATTPSNPALIPSAKRVALNILQTQEPYRPGLDLLHQSAAACVLIQPIVARDVVSLLAPQIPEDAQLAALDKVEESVALQTPEILSAVIRLSTLENSNTVRTKAFDVLSSWATTADASAAIAPLADAILKTVKSTRCVPLREAALPALGRATAAGSDFSGLDALATILGKTSDENRSEPCRSSALRCLAHLGPLLFSPPPAAPAATLASLHRTLVRLLEDDDHDIRREAAEIVEAGLRLRRPVVLSHAVALWWEWLGQGLGAAEAERAVWDDWLWATVADANQTRAELAALSPSTPNNDVLFLEEPPNMFRNSLDAAAHASRVVASLPATTSAGFVATSQLEKEVSAALGGARGSPIDAAWATRRQLEQRQRLLRRALRLD